MAAAPQSAATAGTVADILPCAAPDIEPPDQARCVTLDGSRTNRSVAVKTPNAPRTPCSSQAVHTTEMKNRQTLTLGAGPRKPPTSWQLQELPAPQILPRRTIRAKRPGESVADSAVLVRGGAPCQLRWPANCDWRDTVATAGLRGDRRCCNIDSADDLAGSTAHTL